MEVIRSSSSSPGSVASWEGEGEGEEEEGVWEKKRVVLVIA